MGYFSQDQFIVVTGGGGFIGRHIISFLNRKGFNRIIIIENLATLDFRNLSKLSYFKLLDWRSSFPFLESQKNAISAIIHLGANVERGEIELSKIMEQNYFYSINLVNFAMKNEIRFIYASSSSIYGNGSLGMDDNPSKLSSYEPMDSYSFTKQAFDLYIANSDLLDRVFGLRLVPVMGPDRSKNSRVTPITKLFFEYKEKGVVTLFNEDMKRDLIYVEDVVSLIVNVLDKPMVGIYNVGSGEVIRERAIVELMFKDLNVSPNIAYIPIPEEMKKCIQRFAPMDITRLKEALSAVDVPFSLTPLDQVVKSVVQYYGS